MLLCCLTATTSVAETTKKIRFGVLAFGTANWELAALTHENLLTDAEFQLEIIPMATPQAGKIALQSKAVDVIVSDWIWVSKMRAEHTDFAFYPYSKSSGAIIVPADGSLASLPDLQQKRLGIAGGALDKNWLLLQALAQRKNLNLSSLQTVFGAPPLLNQQLKQGRIDAVLTYWHFAARLEAEGYTQLIDGTEIQQQLGISDPIPMLGYVFRESWGNSNRQTITNFLQKTDQAKDLLCSSQATWNKIKPLTKSENPAVNDKLRQRYCQGRVLEWGEKQFDAAEKIYQFLRQISDSRLTGDGTQIQPGTFWQLD